jgi:hypothetical protein
LRLCAALLRACAALSRIMGARVIGRATMLLGLCTQPRLLSFGRTQLVHIVNASRAKAQRDARHPRLFYDTRR